MRIAHVALWTRDLDVAVRFWRAYFNALVGSEYRSKRRPGFISRFVTLPNCEVQIELMTAPWLRSLEEGDFIGWDHIAISLGTMAAVDEMATRCAAAGILSMGPRITGDGFYEAVITGPDGMLVEITS